MNKPPERLLVEATLSKLTEYCAGLAEACEKLDAENKSLHADLARWQNDPHMMIARDGALHGALQERDQWKAERNQAVFDCNTKTEIIRTLNDKIEKLERDSERYLKERGTVCADNVRLQKDLAKETDYARRLVESCVSKHWSEESPNFKPCDDLPGLLSQLDNMLAGMCNAKVKADKDKAEAKLALLPEYQAVCIDACYTRNGVIVHNILGHEWPYVLAGDYRICAKERDNYKESVAQLTKVAQEAVADKAKAERCCAEKDDAIRFVLDKFYGEGVANLAIAKLQHALSSSCGQGYVSQQYLETRLREVRSEYDVVKAERDDTRRRWVRAEGERDQLRAELSETRQRAVNAEMELLALKSPPLPADVRARMDADREAAKANQPVEQRGFPHCAKCGGETGKIGPDKYACRDPHCGTITIKS